MKDSTITLKCHKVTSGCAEGEALVSSQSIFFYEAAIDPKTGVVTENHALKGKSVTDKILVFPAGKGSSVCQVDGLYKLMLNHAAPRGLIVRTAEAVLAVSAIMANIPLVYKLEKDPLENIHTGDFVKVDADKEIVTVTRHM